MKFNENLQKIAELKKENREIAIQRWRDKYYDILNPQRSFLELDIMINLFAWENPEKTRLCRLFEEETYLCDYNSPLRLVERAEEYGLKIPEIAMEIVCAACVCRNCDICSDCADCYKKHFYGFRTICDE